MKAKTKKRLKSLEVRVKALELRLDNEGIGKEGVSLTVTETLQESEKSWGNTISDDAMEGHRV